MLVGDQKDEQFACKNVNQIDFFVSLLLVVGSSMTFFSHNGSTSHVIAIGALDDTIYFAALEACSLCMYDLIRARTDHSCCYKGKSRHIRHVCCSCILVAALCTKVIVLVYLVAQQHDVCVCWVGRVLILSLKNWVYKPAPKQSNDLKVGQKNCQEFFLRATSLFSAIRSPGTCPNGPYGLFFSPLLFHHSSSGPTWSLQSCV